jgi:heme-degrading monooxygenase HmoA
MYLIVWEYRVPEASRAEFESAYSAEGVWGHFFRGGAGYVRTELLRDVDEPGRYVTFDFWNSEGDFERFAAENREEYQAIDRRTARLTTSEQRLGAWTLDQ